MTVLEKAHKVIELGLFAEDFVTCSDDFINGVFTMVEHYELKSDLLHNVSKSYSEKDMDMAYDKGYSDGQDTREI